MDHAVLLKSALRGLFLPPGLLLFLLLAGLCLRERFARASRYLTWGPLAALFLLSMPVVASLLMQLAEAPPLLNDIGKFGNTQAIVILGGGKRFGAYDTIKGETLNNVTLARVRYGANLARLSKLPVLVTGGSPLGGIPEAELMRQSMASEFGVPVRWVEAGSADTAENATLSAKLLLPQYSRILLVSSASHLPRAEAAFRHAGFEVQGVPTDYMNREPLTPASFLPRALALSESCNALRELSGALWYHLRGYSS